MSLLYYRIPAFSIEEVH